jgi:hypothetical protein
MSCVLTIGQGVLYLVVLILVTIFLWHWLGLFLETLVIMSMFCGNLDLIIEIGEVELNLRSGGYNMRN